MCIYLIFLYWKNNNHKKMNQDLYQKYSLNLTFNSVIENPSNGKYCSVQKWSVCRLCMTNDITKLQEIPWPKWQNHEIIKQFVNITGIKFQASDEIPDFVCKQCIDWIHDTTKQIQIFQEVNQFWNLYTLRSEHTLPNIKSECLENSEIEYISFSNVEDIKLELFTDTTEVVINASPKHNFVDKSHKVDFESENKIEFVEVNEHNNLKTKKKNEILPPKKCAKIIKLSKKKCPYCKIAFVSVVACLSHIRDVHNPSYNRDGEFICYYCDFSFPIKSTLIEHMDLFHRGYQKNQFHCKICKHHFINLYRFRLHIRLAHFSNKQYQCYLCKNMFLQKKFLQRHMVNHLIDRKYICDVCGIVLSTLSSLNRHKKYKNQNCEQLNTCRKPQRPVDQRTISCTLCERKLGTLASLKWHFLKKHSPIGLDEYKKFVTSWCLKCNLNFRSKEQCDEHIKEFHVNKMYGLSVRSFPKKDYFQCDICKQYLCSEVSFKVHQSLHSVKERPFKCIDCGASYTRKTHLTQHSKRVHSTERPFACTLCDWKFANKFELSGHHRIVHLREKKNHCDFCERSFTTKGELATHRANKHIREYKYPCKKCNKKFLTTSQYHCHISKC